MCVMSMGRKVAQLKMMPDRKCLSLENAWKVPSLQTLIRCISTYFDSLYQHILRVNYEAYIRKRSTTCVIDAPSPVGFGGVLNSEDITIQWSTLEVVPDSILEWVICKCKSGCKTKRCSCVKNSLECTELCQCNSCENGRECEGGEIGEDNFDEDISSEDEEDI